MGKVELSAIEEATRRVDHLGRRDWQRCRRAQYPREKRAAVDALTAVTLTASSNAPIERLKRALLVAPKRTAGTHPQVTWRIRKRENMAVVLIRRFVRPDKEREFLAKFKTEKPIDNPNFKGETLLRVNNDSRLPPRLSSWNINAPRCVTYLNVAKWESWEAFAEHFQVDPDDDVASNFDPNIETAARQTVVLDVIDDDVDLDHEEVVQKQGAA